MPEQPPAAARSAGEEELRALLGRFAATRSLAAGALTRIEGGLSNRAWRVDAAGEAWFARLGHPDAAQLGVDRASECVLLHAVSAAGLAPELVACEPSAGLLVTRFVEGRVWQAPDVHVEANLRRVAAQVRRLHSLPVPAGVAEVSYARQARRLAAGLPAPTADERRLLARAEQIFALIERRGRATALCHHDLHHLNMLDDDRLWLVDWEYGGRGDPLFDVAGFLALHELGPAPTATFVEAYGGLAPADAGRLDAARWAFDYVQWLWYRRRFPAGEGLGEGPAACLAQRLLHCDNPRIAGDHG
jgi:thiamine kinase-like enzyme